MHPLDQATDRDVWRNGDHHMDMVRRDVPLEDIDTDLLALCTDDGTHPFCHRSGFRGAQAGAVRSLFAAAENFFAHCSSAIVSASRVSDEEFTAALDTATSDTPLRGWSFHNQGRIKNSATTTAASAKGFQCFITNLLIVREGRP